MVIIAASETFEDIRLVFLFLYVHISYFTDVIGVGEAVYIIKGFQVFRGYFHFFYI